MLLTMRISKLPVPLLLAAAALTSVAVIYVYLQAPPMPIHTDPNFTHPLYPGGVYLWRGAAFEYLFSADGVISLTNRPPHYLLILNGPLGNFSIGDNIWIIYVFGERPLMIVKHYVWRPWGDYPGSWGYEYLVFKLEEVTPPNLTSPELTVWLPTMFELTEFLTEKEYEAAKARVGPLMYRVLTVEVNGTHMIFRVGEPTVYDGSYMARLTTTLPSPISGRTIRVPNPPISGAYTIGNGAHMIFRVGEPEYGTFEYRLTTTLPSPISGRTIRVQNRPITSSYTIGGRTFTAIALPYQYFAIIPTETTTLTVYVN